MYKRIRELREDSDLAQAEIAKILHMHKMTYVRHEIGEREKLKPNEDQRFSFGFLFTE